MQVQDELVLIKGKRSKRPRLQLTMATSSSTTADSASATTVTTATAAAAVISDSNISGSSNSGHDEEEHDMANCLILLAKGTQSHAPPQTAAAAANKAEVIYQCKTCNKSFPSFQALGGHRASHKKPIIEKKVPRDINNINYCKQENSHEDERTILSLQIPSRNVSGNYKTRVHECSICGAEFASGQALGGHMRRHRPMPRAAPPCSGDGGDEEGKRQRNLLSLDLNLPAPEDHNHDHRESKFPFASKEQVIVFSAAPLVDCHIY